MVLAFQKQGDKCILGKVNEVDMSEIKNSFLKGISILKESEDHIEFKEAKNNFDFNGGSVSI